MVDIPINTDSVLDIETHNIEEWPSSTVAATRLSSSSCVDGCHANGTCSRVSESSSKHCCKCGEGYIGNGINCLRESKETKMRWFSL